MAELRVDVEAIGRNTEAVASLLAEYSLDLVAVTKGCVGEPKVAAAMLAGGAVALADTRDQNLSRLRAALPGVELHRIHLPSLTEPFDPGDICYVSSAAGAAAVAALGSARAPREVMILMDTGDEREGAPSEELPGIATAVAAEPRLKLEGIATNYACFKGEPYGIEGSVWGVADAARALRDAGYHVPRVSGGNSSALWLLKRHEVLPEQITELRCGEALLLGQDALFYEPLPGCVPDACVLRAEVLEGYTRRAEQGQVERLVLGIGKQDLGAGVIRFREPGLFEVGRSAEYLVVEMAVGVRPPTAGSTIEMLPAYGALMAAWTSPYVDVRFQGL
jgi:predicted amino acid racemase